MNKKSFSWTFQSRRVNYLIQHLAYPYSLLIVLEGLTYTSFTSSRRVWITKKLPSLMYYFSSAFDSIQNPKLESFVK